MTPNAGRPRDAAIGVFDSGLGGLTVVRELLRHLPGERVVYVGDTAHVPYGGRPLDEIKSFAVGISRFLIEREHCKAVVMACNISSAVARDAVQNLFPNRPVLGVILPGAQAALRAANNGSIAVLTTEGTLRSGAYVRVLNEASPETPVTTIACPAFVPLVEAEQQESLQAQHAARDYLQKARAPHNARVVILGCTHYPFLLPTLRKAAGPDVVFVDPAGETIHVLGRLLETRGLAAEPRTPAHVFYATGDPATFAHGARAFLGEVAAAPRALSWQKGELFHDGATTD